MEDRMDLLRLCFGAAFADGSVQAEEKKVLFDLADKYGLSMSEVSDVWDQFTSGERPRVRLPKDPEQRRVLLEGLLEVVLADDQVTRNEDRFLRRFAHKLKLENELDQYRAKFGLEIWPNYPA